MSILAEASEARTSSHPPADDAETAAALRRTLREAKRAAFSSSVAKASAGGYPDPDDATEVRLLRGLGVGSFEIDAQSAGLAILSEVVSTMRVLTSIIGEINDDEAERLWPSAMTAAQTRLELAVSVMHQEHTALRKQVAEGSPVHAANDEHEQETASPSPDDSWRKVADLLERAREAADDLHHVAAQVTSPTNHTMAGRSYLAILGALREARTACLYWGGQ